ncbi:phage tail fiber protein, partial [Providencia sp. PROV111]
MSNSQPRQSVCNSESKGFNEVLKLIALHLIKTAIRSVESDTQMTLSFPVPVALTDVKYVISITMIGSVSDGVNKATAMVTESYQLMMILNRLMTESGVIKVVLPDGTEMQLRTEKERDRLLDGKFDKTGGVIICRGDPVKFKRESAQFGAFIKFLDSDDTNLGYVGFGSSQNIISLSNQKEGTSLTLGSNKSLKFNGTDVMLAGDYGWGGIIAPEVLNDTQIESKIKTQATQTWRNNSSVNAGKYAYQYAPNLLIKASDTFWNMSVQHSSGNVIITAGLSQGNPESQYRINRLYGTSNTTKDSNGNLKAASPVVKLFADNIELNEESEGVEMEHLGIG